MNILTAFDAYQSKHPGDKRSPYGGFNPDDDNCGPFAGLPAYEGGEAFNSIQQLNIGPGVGHGHFGTTPITTGGIQTQNSSAAGGLQFAGSTPPGLVMTSPATVDGWFSARGVVPAVNPAQAPAPEFNYTVGGLGRFALPASKTTVERMFFGYVGSGVNRVAHGTAIPASGTCAVGILSTDVGLSYVAQGTTAFAGGATVIGTWAQLGITDNRWFTLGFRAHFSGTAALCRGAIWVNGVKYPVPAANLASFVTNVDARGMVSLTSASGAAASLPILGAKVLVRYNHMGMYGV